MTLNPEKLEVIREMDPRVQKSIFEMTATDPEAHLQESHTEQISGEGPTCDKMEDMIKMLSVWRQKFRRSICMLSYSVLLQSIRTCMSSDLVEAGNAYLYIHFDVHTGGGGV